MVADPIRILIVDDSALYRLMVRDVLGAIDGCTVAGTAENGTRALEQVNELQPDLVTLDVEMPGMSGIEVLREMKQRDCQAKVIMLSHYTDAGAQTTMDALLEGAFDFICKPAGKDRNANKERLRNELASKIAAFSEAHRNESAPEQAAPDDGQVAPPWNCAVVIIGASTGGPEALRSLLPKLPLDFSIPIVVVQHMPGQFTKPLAERLDGVSPLKVVEAEEGSSLAAGTVFVAPGGRHLQLVGSSSGAAIHLTDAPRENNCRPAVDYTLRSACESLAGRALAVILTGMGRDGLRGSSELKELGGRVVAQHANGCTVFGMPKAVINAGLADRIARLPHLPAVICDEVRRGTT